MTMFIEIIQKATDKMEYLQTDSSSKQLINSFVNLTGGLATRMSQNQNVFHAMYFMLYFHNFTGTN